MLVKKPIDMTTMMEVEGNSLLDTPVGPFAIFKFSNEAATYHGVCQEILY